MNSIETAAIASLNFDPANARKHSDKNLQAIKGSLARFGQQKPIVVDGKNIVIAGNGTLAAAKALGWSEIQVLRTALTGPEAIAFALADNRSSELAEWDFTILQETLQSLKNIDFPINEIGFDLNVPGSLITGSEEFSEDEFQEFNHQCPKCGFEYDEKKKK